MLTEKLTAKGAQFQKRRKMKSIEQAPIKILCYFFGKCKLPKHYRRSTEQRLMIHLLRDGK